MSLPHWKSIDFSAINAICLARMDTLMPIWLPSGQPRGCEWCALNPTRTDRNIGSFSVNMTTGHWADFATNDAGGDPISLYAYLNGLRQTDAARALAKFWGVMA